MVAVRLSDPHVEILRESFRRFFSANDQRVKGRFDNNPEPKPPPCTNKVEPRPPTTVASRLHDGPEAFDNFDVVGE